MSHNEWEESVKLSPPYSRKPTPGLHEKVEAAVKKANADFDRAATNHIRASYWDEIRGVVDEFEQFKGIEDSKLLPILMSFVRDSLKKYEADNGR